MLADGFVQMPILFPHSQLLVAGKIVETHGDFDQHAVQSEKDVHHLVGIAPSMPRLLCSILHALRHWVHRMALFKTFRKHSSRDKGSNREMEIETIDGLNRFEWAKVSA